MFQRFKCRLGKHDWDWQKPKSNPRTVLRTCDTCGISEVPVSGIDKWPIKQDFRPATPEEITAPKGFG